MSKKVIDNKSFGGLLPYARSHLAELCRGLSDTIDEIDDIRLHPGRNVNQAGRIAFLEPLVSEEMDYIAKAICDIREAETRLAKERL
jgi:hypothetical protein